MRRCPPGVICIENVTISLVMLVVIGVIAFFYTRPSLQPRVNDSKIIIEDQRDSWGASTNSVLLNPYEAPLRDDRVFRVPLTHGMPINVRTQGVETDYRQVGILTKNNNSGEATILPLMGKPLLTNRDKWNFYTMNDKNNMIKLPITFKNKSCTNEYGCDNIYNGDTVYVEGYNETFKATVYDNQVMRYIPFL
tara:strand:+ start:617 stop:1195 length:579 start_codon:yes stop_codon:yes gene_type:complete